MSVGFQQKAAVRAGVALARTPSERPLLIAKAYLALKRKTGREFAAFHGKSEQWIYQVFNGRAPAPQSFRNDLAAFLGVPVELLFPDESNGKAS